MPNIDLLTISRAEALKVARAVFGMTPTQAEEFVTLARGEEASDVEPQEIKVKAFGGFVEGLHPRIPAGMPKGGQFIKKGGRLLKKGLQTYWKKTRTGREVEASIATGALSGIGSASMGLGLMGTMMGVPTGIPQVAGGAAVRYIGNKLQSKIGNRRTRKRNQFIHDFTSGATSAGILMGPGIKQGFQRSYRAVFAKRYRDWKRHQIMNAYQGYMATRRGLPAAPKGHVEPRIINLSKRHYRFREASMKARKLPKLGSGARFAKLEGQLAKKGIRDPGALAAAIGRKKYGAKRFAKLSAHGRKEYTFKETTMKYDLASLISRLAETQPDELGFKAFGSFNESKHKRYPKGNPLGGHFAPMGGSLRASARDAGTAVRAVGRIVKRSPGMAGARLAGRAIEATPGRKLAKAAWRAAPGAARTLGKVVKHSPGMMGVRAAGHVGSGLMKLAKASPGARAARAAGRALPGVIKRSPGMAGARLAGRVASKTPYVRAIRAGAKATTGAILSAHSRIKRRKR